MTIANGEIMKCERCKGMKRKPEVVWNDVRSGNVGLLFEIEQVVKVELSAGGLRTKLIIDLGE